jgi:hypothetical protein
MAGKSRRARGRHSQLSKKRKKKRTTTFTARQQPAVAPTYKPAAPAEVAAPQVKEPTPAVARFPHITAELRSIGIIAGILLATLVVLAFVLP